MIELYLAEQALKTERALLDRLSAQRAASLECGASVRRPPWFRPRRRLALILLAVADRLDPRPVLSAAQPPSRPRLNGTLHHA